MSKKVLAAVIVRDSNYLVCLRPAGKHHGGLWEFPGGKLEPGETLADAARRELKEELDLDLVSIGEELFSIEDKSSGYRICFVSCEASGEPRLLEHEKFIWASLEDLSRIALAPSDQSFTRFLADRHNL